MERGLSLLIATVILFVAPGVQAQFNFTFLNNTQLNITRTGCGVTKLCVSSPSQCDPAGNSTCLFASTKAGNTSATNGTTVSFELSGNSTGYIALGLSPNTNPTTALVFVCGQNNSTNGIFFTTALLNTTSLLFTQLLTTVTEKQGNVNGPKIQCAFTVPNLNSTAMSKSINSSTNFAIILGSGSLTGNTLGSFTLNLISSFLNIADPAANVVTPTTTAPTGNITTTTGAGGALHPHAVTLVLSVLTLCALKLA